MLRDPKTDPRKGDVLIRRKGITQFIKRTVEKETEYNYIVATEIDHTGFSRTVMPFRSHWALWARTAEVLHASEG